MVWQVLNIFVLPWHKWLNSRLNDKLQQRLQQQQQWQQQQ